MSIVPIFYSNQYILTDHTRETTRKSAWLEASLATEPISGIEIRVPTPLDQAAIMKVHAPAYVTAVRTGEPRSLAESQEFVWDSSLWPTVLASNGGVVAAALAARDLGVAGSFSSGMHHAHYSHGMGYCTFNGLVLAARAVLETGAQRVLILDLDAHCGGGTHELIANDDRIWQVDVAVDAYDNYEPTSHNTRDLVLASSEYLPTIDRRLTELPSRAGKFDLCLYNAGMDPHERCPDGGLSGISTVILHERERKVFEWSESHRVPIAFVVAGGYVGPDLSQSELVTLHRMTMLAATGRRV